MLVRIVPIPMSQALRMGLVPLRMVPSGAFPVPDSVPLRNLPPAVKANLARLAEAPPKPVVTPQVMNEAAATMIAPDLPFKGDV